MIELKWIHYDFCSRLSGLCNNYCNQLWFCGPISMFKGVYFFKSQQSRNQVVIDSTKRQKMQCLEKIYAENQEESHRPDWMPKPNPKVSLRPSSLHWLQCPPRGTFQCVTHVLRSCSVVLNQSILGCQQLNYACDVCFN